MNRVGAVLGLLLAASSWAEPAPLTLRAVHSLSSAEAARGLPVDLEGTVTYYDGAGKDLFVQDGDAAVYVYAPRGAGLVPGDRIRVQGTTNADFRPDVFADQISLLHHGVPPVAARPNFAELIRAEFDCMRVTMRARVRSANLVHNVVRDVVPQLTETNLYLNLVVDGGEIDALVPDHDESRLKNLLDADVEITGAVAGKFDSKMQLAGIMLEVPTPADIRVLAPADIRPDRLPVTPLDEVMAGYSVTDNSRRIRVRGSITYYESGKAVVLQEGRRSLWIPTQFEGPLRGGEVVDATGFPDAHDGYATLTRSEITKRSLLAPVSPVQSDAAELASGKHAFDLVSTVGSVLVSVRGAARDEYVLNANGRLFSAIYRHPEAGSGALPALKQIAPGSQVRVTGICTLEHGSDPLGAPLGFNLLLRDLDDLTIEAGPSWFDIRHMVEVVGVLLVILIGLSVRGWVLERRVHRHSLDLARRTETETERERRRSRILEDMNAGRKLSETLEQITDLVSFSLDGTACWCVLANGVRLGASAPLAGTICRHAIPSRAGAAHGELCIAADGVPTADANAALIMGVGLAALAIETRGLYSDLVYRSEYDLLTEVYNRFSLEKRLDEAIEDARRQAALLGVLYIDLDKFKQVNDSYGHRVGDLFLQEAAQRMKRQLRPGDMLARMGGDEFGVVVPAIPSRARLVEIAERLDSSFDEPFVIEGYALRASASIGIAVYPHDGESRDSLLNAADAAMYAAKQTGMLTFPGVACPQATPHSGDTKQVRSC